MKDLSLHILDIAQNSISAKATLIQITIDEDRANNRYVLTIEDNGIGMSPEVLEKVTDPYTTSRTTRKVGLGLPLLKLSAEQASGNLEVTSELGVGTKVTAMFEFDHIDRVPIGDIAGVVVMLASMNPSLEFIYKHITPKGDYIFDTKEVKGVLGDLSIQNISIQKYLKEMVEENLKEIGYDK
ncbi:MAG: ATP-binding protein [Bacteroidales bacterium]|nr:ATP-binding protein [Bacteroidales bacterium]